MAQAAYIGVGDKARSIKSAYIGVNGVARQAQAGYIGVEGVARQFLSSGWTGYLINGTTTSEFGLPTSTFYTGSTSGSLTSCGSIVKVSGSKIIAQPVYTSYLYVSFWTTPFNLSAVKSIVANASSSSTSKTYVPKIHLMVSPILPTAGMSLSTLTSQLVATSSPILNYKAVNANTSIDASGLSGKYYLGIYLNNNYNDDKLYQTINYLMLG